MPKPADRNLVDTSRISKNPLNPRTFFRQEEMDSLKDSIARLGILVPLVVFPDEQTPGNHVLLDGERRLRCAQDLGLKAVPVHVTTVPSPTDNILLMFNIHSLREQWDPYTVAKALEKLMVDLGTRNSRELATLTGFTIGNINRSKKLLRLPPTYMDMLKAELEKPKTDQLLTEDFFLEAGDAVSAIRRFQPEVYADYGQTELLDRLIARRKTGRLKNIVDLRVIADIANYKKIKISKRASERQLRDIIEDPDSDLRHIYRVSVQPTAGLKSLGGSISRLTGSLSQLDLANLTETAAAELAQSLSELVLAARRILDELANA